MARVDYIDDPNAPRVNSVVPSVVAVVQDNHGRVLLIHKTDNGKWALPGGVHEPGETIAQTVQREVLEETGYQVVVEAITGLYTQPGHVMAYDDGEVRQQFSIAFRARLVGGDCRTSDESDEVRWIHPNQLDGLEMHPSMRQRLADALNGTDGPAIR